MRLPRYRVPTMVVLVAIIALTFAGLRWLLVAPTASRLPTGSVAVLDPDEPRSGASVAVYPLSVEDGMGQYVPVRVRSRVKVLDDSKPSSMNSFSSDGITVIGEGREVKIIVLDGAKEGFVGFVSRFSPRPARLW